uniref:Target of Myb protein 1 n=1 Tax=Kalanchoe fedtschenkoi TaxID=63787 RepID=A0A7N0V9I4_KALFE
MVNAMVERATNDMLIGPDWAMNLEICDMINRDPSQAKDVIKGIKKKLGSKNPKVQLLTLTLLETLVKNCGDMVHMHVAEKDVLHELVRIIKKKPDFHVKDKILILIDTWQEAFGGPRARYPQYYAAYQELLRAGAVFPQRQESTAPVFTPPQSRPLSTYPPNVRNSDFPQEAPAETSSQSQFPTLSVTEIQNARGIMDVLSEMLNALEPGNKEGLRQEVIVDLVEQCRTYKQRVVQLVSNTDDETLLCQGIQLNEELGRLLEKHETIASGAPIRVEQPRTEPARELVPVDRPLIDTEESSKPADKRPTSTANAGAQAEPPLLALAAPSTPTLTPPTVKLDPKIDLLSGDDYNSPMAQNNLALVPVGEAQPISPVSEQNALVLVDFYSESNTSSAQPSYLTGQIQSSSPFYQQQNSSLQPMQYANEILQSQQQNPQSSQSMSYANGSAQTQQPNSHLAQPSLHSNGIARNPGGSQYEQSNYTQSGTPAWNGQQQQQQQPPAVYGRV